MSGLQVGRVLHYEMTMTDNAALLRDYVRSHSEQAFGVMVARHFDMVYSVALRLVGGDAHGAQDVAQTVFTDLARRAALLPRQVVLAGWLYRHTCFTASKWVRAERRRHAREKQAFEMNELNHSSDADWQELAPVLDEALNDLGAEDRNAVILRFFQRQDFRSVGDAIGASEDGARKRVGRAVEKLRTFLARKGVGISSAGLAVVLVSHSIAAAPAGLGAVVAASSLAEAASSSLLSLTLIKLMTMTKLKIATAAAVLTVGVATPMVLQYQTNARLQEENRALRDGASLLQERAQAQSNVQNQGESPLTRQQLEELLRLRGEIGLLKRQLADLPKLRQENDRLRQRAVQATGPEDPPEDPAREQDKAMGIAKMTHLKQWALACHLYAEEHNGQLPSNFADAAAFVPTDPASGIPLPINQYETDYEVMYRGKLSDLTNPPPAMAILVREKQPWRTANGTWARAYGFADGHSEIHSDPTGDFQAWETSRLAKAQ